MLFLPNNVRNPELLPALKVYIHTVINHHYISLSFEGEKWPCKHMKV